MIGVGCAAFVAEADLVGAGVGPCAVEGGADGESGEGSDGCGGPGGGGEGLSVLLGCCR